MQKMINKNKFLSKEKSIDFKDDVVSHLHAEKDEVLKGVAVSLMSIFRTNFDAFEDMIFFYSSHRKYAQSMGKTAIAEIGKILLSKGITRSDGKPISSAHISRYMAYVRKERKVKPSVVVVSPLPDTSC